MSESSRKPNGSNPEPLYLSSAESPYGQHYANEPESFRDWENAAMAKLDNGWRKAGKPTGVQVNDHNWVKLGQGHTLGLVAGSLSIGEEEQYSLSKLDGAARQGLFAAPGLYPAIVRFSDFGADDASKVERLARMAVKLAFPGAWHGEVNLTLAETVDQFSLENFDDIAFFVDDPEHSGFLDKLRFRASKAVKAFNSRKSLLREWKSGDVLSKTFFSQLAYMLGPERAFKYRLTALQDPVGDVDDTPEASRMILREWLDRAEAKFQLEIQLNDDPSSELVRKQAGQRWDAEWLPVGVLTLARQAVNETSVGVVLEQALSEELGLSGEQRTWLHKSLMFHPLLTADEHMPVGETQQFRSHFYPRAARQRLDLFAEGRVEPLSVPFDKLTERPDTAALFAASTTRSLSSVDEPPELAKMDHYTKTLCKLIPPKVIEANRKPLTDAALKNEEVNLYGPQESHTINVGKVSVTIMNEDEVLGELGLAPWLLLRTLRTDLLFPMDDVFVDCDSEEAQVLQNHIGLTQSLPLPTHHWDEMSSDEAFTRIFFYGTGAVMLEAYDNARDPETRYVVDTAYLKDLEIRPGFRPYGCRVHFDADQKLLGIFDYEADRMVSSGDADWGHVKHLAKQSLAMPVTGVQHLLWSHFCVANTMVNASVTHLPVDSCLRRLLVPFSFRTTYVNNRAKDSLLPEYSMFHHSTGLTYDGVTQLIEEGAASCDLWRPFPEQAEALGPRLNALAEDGRFPYISDGLAYYKTVKRFVDAWLAEGYPSDEALTSDKAVRAFWRALVSDTESFAHGIPADLSTRDQLSRYVSQFILVVTAYHEIVGAVVEYTDLDRCGFRVRPGATRNDVQSWLVSACLMSTTSINTPKLLGSTFPNYFKPGFEADSWARFQDELQKLAEANDKLNQGRRFQFLGFNPRVLESAISV